MKPHKHAELIKAWADGAEIEYKSKFFGTWHLFDNNKDAWVDSYEYRIKTKPKLDVFRYASANINEFDWYITDDQTLADNLKITFDGETGELKSAEVLK